MAIAPTSVLYLLRGCPLSPDYKHSLHFADKNTQTFYFRTLSYVTGNRYTYLREDEAIKVECDPGQAQLCNYIMYNNSMYLNKWFYAFITRVEYINDNTAKIYIQEDVIQTWFMDAQLMPCWVEREHTETDEIGDNLIEENLNYGEYIIREQHPTGELSAGIVIAATTDETGEAIMGGKMVSHSYNGLNLIKPSTVTLTNKYIADIVSNASEQAIVSIFMAPIAFYNGSENGVEKTVSLKANVTDIDGYVPKNKKLFTYPYNFILANNYMGQTAVYRYEFFNGDGLGKFDIEFSLNCDQTCNPTVIMCPKDYKNVVEKNYNEKISLTGWPQCSYTTDSFKAYLALHSTENFIKVGSSALMGAIPGALTGNPIGAITTGGISALSNIMSIGAKYSALDNLPPQASSIQPGSGMLSLNHMDIDLLKITITAEFAKQIDDFWSLYGYPIRRIKIPNISSRPWWNYVKTADCKIKGPIPQYAIEKIQQCFDNGITWWGRGDILGDYSLDNSPAGGGVDRGTKE